MLSHHKKQLEYATTQPWFNQYVANTLKSTYSSPFSSEYESIVDVFSWSDTPEGDGFWWDIEQELERLFSSDSSYTTMSELKELISSKFPKDDFPEYYI